MKTKKKLWALSLVAALCGCKDKPKKDAENQSSQTAHANTDVEEESTEMNKEKMTADFEKETSLSDEEEANEPSSTVMKTPSQMVADNEILSSNEEPPYV